MKVLITDGSNPITWYHGLEGKVLPVTHIKDAHYFVPDEFVPDGGVFGPCGVHFPDGELFYTAAEYSKANQELLQRREEVKQLMKDKEIARLENDALYKDFRNRTNSLDRANETISKLCLALSKEREEKALLLQQIERTLEEQPKPVVLPKEVAEAIDKLRATGWATVDLLNTVEFINSKWDPVIQPGHAGYSIAKYLGEKNFLTYTQAIVNGYTVEETLSEKINKRVRELLFGSKDEDDFAAMVSNFVIGLVKEAK